MFRNCILSTPRTGSTWLTTGIGGPYSRLKNYVDLGEFFTPYSDGWNGYSLDENNIIKKIDCTDLPDNVEDFAHNQIQLLLSGNIKQPLILKYMYLPYFVQDNLNNHLKILKKIQDHSIKIINLNRDIFESTISVLVVARTGLWARQRLLFDQEDWATDEGKKFNIDLSTLSNIEIDPGEFQAIYLENLNMFKEKQKISDALGCVTVNYDSLSQDCKDNKIYFRSVNRCKKLYDFPYSDLVTNYNQLLEIANAIKASYE